MWGDPLLWEYYQDTQDWDTATVMSASAGASTTVDFNVAPAGQITGQVKSSVTSSPMPDVDVVVFDPTGEDVAWGWTDGSGNYVAGGLPTDQYRVWFRPASWWGHNGEAAEFHNDVPTIDQATPVQVTAGQTRTVNATLDAGGCITGTVVGADTDLPLPGIYVRSLMKWPTGDRNPTGVNSQNTDASGVFTFCDSCYGGGCGMAGEFYVAFYDYVNYAYLSEFYDNQHFNSWDWSWDTVNPTPIMVTRSQTTTLGTVKLDLEGCVSGRTLDAGNRIWPFANVNIWDWEGDQVAWDSSDDQGWYSYCGLLPGDYLVTCEQEADDTLWRGSATVTVNVGGAANADCVLGRPTYLPLITKEQ